MSVPTTIVVKTKANQTVATVYNTSEDIIFWIQALKGWERRQDCLPLKEGKWSHHLGTVDCYLQLARTVRAHTNHLGRLARIEWSIVANDILPPLQYFIKTREDPFKFAQEFHKQTLLLLAEAMKKIPSQPNYLE